MFASDNESTHDYSGRREGGAFEGQSVEELSSTSSDSSGGSSSDVEVVGTAVDGEDVMDVQPLSTVHPTHVFRQSGPAEEATQSSRADPSGGATPSGRANPAGGATPSQEEEEG